MAAPMNFRTAFNGFNREDVVHFVEYLNARHTAEINQLKAELDLLRSRADAVQQADHSAELAAALEENAALKAQVAELRKRCEEAEKAPAANSGTAQELEAYRRAERTERIARERAEQVYHQANGALADAAVKVDVAFAQLSDLSERVGAQLAQLQEAVTGSRQALADASATLYSIRPTGENS